MGNAASNQGLIIGLTVGAVVLLIIIIITVVCCCCRKAERSILKRGFVSTLLSYLSFDSIEILKLILIISV